MKLLALLLLVACGGTYVVPDLNPPPGKDVRRVLGAGALLRPQWQSTHWARPSDAPDLTMVYFVVAYDGSACIVPANLWALVQDGDAVRCSPWRAPR